MAPGVDRGRIEAALARASEVTEESGRIVAEARERRRRTLVLSCAWCGRYLVDGEYVEPPTAQPFLVTHGICPACFDELRRTGKSR